MRPATSVILAAAVLAAATAAACSAGDPASPVDRGAPDAVAPPSLVDGGAAEGGDADAGPGYAWSLPPGFPVPRVPADNPMSEAKVALGRRLFYDVRLSGNQTFSCGSCHEQGRAFTDGRALAIGATGAAHARSSMSLANVAYASGLTWANPLIGSLEKQVLVPMYGREPVELGSPDEPVLLARLASDPEYPRLFAEAFPGAPPSLDAIAKSIASFERTILSGRTPYDRYVGGEATALSESAKRGLELFNSERLECYHCHVGFAFSDSIVHAGSTFLELPFHNTGLYNVDGAGAYPTGNRGVFELSQLPRDMGRFRAPSLRNLGVTAPFMHDGSAATLDDVLDHYAAGGRTIASGPNAGVGSTSPLKNELVRGFTLTPGERSDLLAFLQSLDDPALLTDPRFASPFGLDAGAQGTTP